MTDYSNIYISLQSFCECNPASCRNVNKQASTLRLSAVSLLCRVLSFLFVPRKVIQQVTNSPSNQSSIQFEILLWPFLRVSRCLSTHTPLQLFEFFFYSLEALTERYIGTHVYSYIGAYAKIAKKKKLFFNSWKHILFCEYWWRELQNYINRSVTKVKRFEKLKPPPHPIQIFCLCCVFWVLLNYVNKWKWRNRKSDKTNIWKLKNSTVDQTISLSFSNALSWLIFMRLVSWRRVGLLEAAYLRLDMKCIV